MPPPFVPGSELAEPTLRDQPADVAAGGHVDTGDKHAIVACELGFEGVVNGVHGAQHNS